MRFGRESAPSAATAAFSSLLLLLLLAASSAPAHARPVGSSFGVPGVDSTYDYVVVGGGTAGLTIASRLVEQGAGTVAVVEAGTFAHLSNGNLSQIPAFATTWVGKNANDWQPGADWGYQTTPQPGAFNKSLHYPHGKMLGGCSARNFMVYHRSTAGAYQRWADMVGDQSYAFDKWLPYFEKSLKFSPPRQDLRLANATPQFDVSTLGNGKGPLSLTFPNWAYAFPTWATKAFSQMGLRPREGLQNGQLIGQAYAMFTIDKDTMLRSSSETAFLQRSLDDTRFYVYPLTDAKRILFDGSKTANGVAVESLGANFTLHARKEVILSAGVIGSPQLLQVSGVGPSDLLRPLGIPVNAITPSSLGNPAFAARQIDLYNSKPAKGLLTSPAADLLGFEKLPNSTRSGWGNGTLGALAAYPADWPEVEYIAFSGYLGDISVVSTADPMDGVAYATMGVVLVAPRSRGTVSILSADTAVQPRIDPAFLTERSDVDVAVGGFKRAREFWRQRSLQGFKVGPERYPGPAVPDGDDAAIEASIRQSFQTIFHGSCTCAMGKEDDPRAVVDAKARVYGVRGLRVVDASAFPLLPPGHPQSTVYALAEKIACDISGAC